MSTKSVSESDKGIDHTRAGIGIAVKSEDEMGQRKKEGANDVAW